VQTLRARPDLAQRVRHVRNALKDNKTPFHLVPMFLAGMHGTPLTPRTLSIAQTTAARPLLLGRGTHDSFLQSYASLRSVSTLELVKVAFESLSYFILLLSSFRSLRDVYLHNITIHKLDRYPACIAKQKRLQIHDLRWEDLHWEVLPHFARWTVQSGALRSVERLSLIVPLRELRSLSAILRSARHTLKDLSLCCGDWKTGEDNLRSNYVNCEFNISLNTFRFIEFPLEHILLTLSSLRSQKMSLLDLGSVEVDGPGDMHSIVDRLVSLQPSVLGHA